MLASSGVNTARRPARTLWILCLAKAQSSLWVTQETDIRYDAILFEWSCDAGASAARSEQDINIAASDASERTLLP